MGCTASTTTSNPSMTKKAGKNVPIILGYWDFRGYYYGNVMRFLLAYGYAKWEEKTFTRSDDTEWLATKPTLMEFANLPYIIHGDFKLSETMAIHQYIAEKYCPSVNGTTPQEKARSYQLQSIGCEFGKCIGMAFDPTQTKETICEEVMDKLAALGNLLEDDRKFLTGDKPIIADFILFEHINYANHMNGGKTYKRYPKAEAFHGRMANLPGLKEYLAGKHHALSAGTYMPFPPALVDIN